MSSLLTDHWLPALSQICVKAGYGAQGISAMEDSAINYLYKRERRQSVEVGEPIEATPKPFVLGVGADIWRSGEAYDLVEALQEQILTSPGTMRSFRGGLELSWQGIGQENLWEIPNAVEFALDLDRSWPYAFFFLSRDGYALRDLACAVHVSGGNVGNHASEVWLPALADACEAAGLGQDEFQHMGDTALTYLRKHLT